jgi:chromosome segregation ATPase
MQIFDYKKKIAEAETKYKQQQNLYEAVRSDRNLYSKNLIERQDEINENRRKLKIMTHQIDQLKEEIQNKLKEKYKTSLKENTLVDEHYNKIIYLLNSISKNLNNDDSFKLHEKLKKFFNRLI